MERHYIRQAIVLLACLVAILILASGPGVANAGYNHAPQALLFDDFDYRGEISAVPFTYDLDIAPMTSALDDPAIPCPTPSQRYKTIWFSYTPTRVGKLHVDTYGSGYDTVLVVWRGTRGSLIKVGCSNDAGGTKQSEVNVLAMGSTTYYIEVAAFWPNQLNTMMHLNVDFTQKNNLLLNGGFELDGDVNGIPDHWLDSGAFHAAPCECALGGSFVGNLYAEDNGNYYTNQAVAVVGGHAYRFLGFANYYFRFDETYTFRVLARWRNASNTVISTDTIFTSSFIPYRTWIEMNKTLVAPAGAASVLIVPSAVSLNGNIFIDKFFFVEWWD